MSKIISAFGNDFKSIKECCEYYEISAGAFRLRYEKGEDPEEIIYFLSNQPKVKSDATKPKSVEYNGKKYESILQAVKDLNLENSRFVIGNRMADGETFEEAVNNILNKRKQAADKREQRDKKNKEVQKRKEALQVVLGGVVYKSCNSACEALNISTSTCTKLMKEENISRKEALTIIYNKRNNIEETVEIEQKGIEN